MQLDQTIRRFGARMSAGLAALVSRSKSAEGWKIKIDKGTVRRGLLLLPALIVLYYLIGAAWSHKVDSNPNFDIPPDARIENDSYAVGLAIGLLDREVNQNGWVANSPFYLPTALLHNMASFQTGIVGTIREFAEVMDEVLKARGITSVDLEVTADKLSKRPDIWSWDWSEPWGYLGNSEREYREALLDLQGYNVALTDGTSILPKDAPALAAILKRFAAELRGAAQDLESEAAYRPLLLSRRLGDAMYHARGIAYCELILLRGLKADFGALLGQRNLLEAWRHAEDDLKRVAVYSPMFVINGSPDNVLLPSHPLTEGYYALDAERALSEIIAKLS